MTLYYYTRVYKCKDLCPGVLQTCRHQNDLQGFHFPLRNLETRNQVVDPGFFNGVTVQIWVVYR